MKMEGKFHIFDGSAAMQNIQLRTAFFIVSRLLFICGIQHIYIYIYGMYAYNNTNRVTARWTQ